MVHNASNALLLYRLCYAEMQTITVNETIRKRLSVCKESKNMHSNCAFTGHKLSNPSKAYRSYTKVTKVVGICVLSTLLLLLTHIFAQFRGGRGVCVQCMGRKSLPTKHWPGLAIHRHPPPLSARFCARCLLTPSTLAFWGLGEGFGSSNSVAWSAD